MGTLLEELKAYFRATPREQVLKDWAKTERFDSLGPTIDEFFLQNELYRLSKGFEIKPEYRELEYINNYKKSEDFFGLFFIFG